MLRCTSSRHAGNRWLPDSAFGIDASKATGRTPDCRRCRRLIAADTRRRAKLAHPPPRRQRGVRLCAHEGCIELPERKNRIYCPAHRKHDDYGRHVVRPQASRGSVPATRHDLAIRLLAEKR